MNTLNSWMGWKKKSEPTADTGTTTSTQRAKSVSVKETPSKPRHYGTRQEEEELPANHSKIRFGVNEVYFDALPGTKANRKEAAWSPTLYEENRDHNSLDALTPHSTSPDPDRDPWGSMIFRSTKAALNAALVNKAKRMA